MDKYWELTKALSNDKTQEVVEEFLLSLKLMNRSKGTIIQYRLSLERFFGDMDEPFSSITSEKIQKWFIEKEAHVKETTFKFRLSILSSFYRFCVQEGYMNQSPIKSRWYPRVPLPIPKYLEKEDIAKTRLQSEMNHLRDQLLVEFMLTSGCRVGEVSRLDRKDIDIKNRSVHVVGKGNKINTLNPYMAPYSVIASLVIRDLSPNQLQSCFYK